MQQDRSLMTRLLAVVAAVIAAAVVVSVVVQPSFADERDDQVKKRDATQKELDKTRSSLEGVNDKLASTVIKLKEVDGQLDTAQQELATAQANVESQKREQENLADRLAVAEADLDKVTKDLQHHQQMKDETKDSIAELARANYRGGTSSSPVLAFAFTTTSAQDLTKASEAANTAARLQSEKLSEIEVAVADTRNKQARQDALTEQVKELKRQADALLVEYQQAQHDKEQKLASVEKLQAQQQNLKADLENQKGSLEDDIAALEKTQAETQARIAAIDAENRRKAAEAAAKQAKRNRAAGNLLIAPISGPLYVTSPFGWRTHPVLGTRMFHAGVDFASPTGQAQYATASGTVAFAGWNGTCGQGVIINHGWLNGATYQTVHCHLSRINVRPGQRVGQGQVIGLTGATGRVTGPHVHYEVWKNGVLINPMTLPGF